MVDFRFKAFISYSHRNSVQAEWLLKKLESYRIPPHLNASRREFGRAGETIGRIFRDREVLPASGSMDDDIQRAIADAEYLIVVCSRDAVRSSRVNSEIRHFISARDSSKILCYVIDGEPTFEAKAIGENLSCIPPELRKLRLVTGLTPLAADARATGDGRKNAVNKIVAGLLGVNLDELLRRDLKRKNRKLSIVAAASFAMTLTAVGLLLRANHAEQSEKIAKEQAQLEQARAEDLIGFMLDDLIGVGLQKLGRTDVLDAVVSKIVDHYSQLDDDALSPEELGRKVNAYQQLGKLYLGKDLRDPAQQLFEYAYETTAKNLKRHPDLDQLVFDHAESLYWVGLNHIFNGRYEEAEQAWGERVQVGEQLWQSEQHPYFFWSRMADYSVHHGWALMEVGKYQEALAAFEKGLVQRKSNAARFSDEIGWLNSVGGGHYHMQWVLSYLGRNDEALVQAQRSNRLYALLAEADPHDQRARGNYARSLRWRAELEIALGLNDAATKHLRQSIELHQQLLDYEPQNTTFQYQGCVSSVMLSELHWRRGEAVLAEKTLDSGCFEPETTLSLNHFKVHNRFYGYRRALLELDMALFAKETDHSREIYSAIIQRWNREPGEIKRSTQGQMVGLELAIQAASMHLLDGSMPQAPINLTAQIEQIASSNSNGFAGTQKQLDRARKLALLVEPGLARAR